MATGGLFILSRELRAHRLDVQACAPCNLPFVSFAFFVRMGDRPSSGIWRFTGPGFSCFQFQNN